MWNEHELSILIKPKLKDMVISIVKTVKLID